MTRKTSNRNTAAKKATGPKAYYKVVLVRSLGRNEAMTSAVARGSARRAYRIGKVALPIRGTGLLAFSGLKHARTFAHDFRCLGRLAILKGSGSERPLGHMAYPGSAPWEMKRHWGQKSTAWDWPPGTVALKWFKPEKEAR